MTSFSAFSVADFALYFHCSCFSSLSAVWLMLNGHLLAVSFFFSLWKCFSFFLVITANLERFRQLMSCFCSRKWHYCDCRCLLPSPQFKLFWNSLLSVITLGKWSRWWHSKKASWIKLGASSASLCVHVFTRIMENEENVKISLTQDKV